MELKTRFWVFITVWRLRRDTLSHYMQIRGVRYTSASKYVQPCGSSVQQFIWFPFLYSSWSKWILFICFFTVICTDSSYTLTSLLFLLVIYLPEKGAKRTKHELNLNATLLFFVFRVFFVHHDNGVIGNLFGHDDCVAKICDLII